MIELQHKVSLSILFYLAKLYTPNKSLTKTGSHWIQPHPYWWYFFFLWCCGPTRAMASSFLRFLDQTQWRITVGRTPLDEWSARRRDLYLTTHNTHNRQISMPPVGFEPTISAGERPQTHALDSTATGCISHRKSSTGRAVVWPPILREGNLSSYDSAHPTFSKM